VAKCIWIGCVVLCVCACTYMCVCLYDNTKGKQTNQLNVLISCPFAIGTNYIRKNICISTQQNGSESAADIKEQTEVSDEPISSDPEPVQPVAEVKAVPSEASADEVAKPVEHDEFKDKEPHNDNPQPLKRRSTEAYETLMTFVLRQSEDLREQFLDVYASPKLNPILLASYSELKHMEKEEQERVWNALLTRWKRFI
ncbi:hypothetical protein RFI_29861, partial [Reticulomyxa filosa]